MRSPSCCSSGCRHATRARNWARDAAIAKAEAILKNLQDGRTADIVAEFDARLSKELPEARLKPVWPGLVAQFGAFKSIAERREGPMQERQAVELILVIREADHRQSHGVRQRRTRGGTGVQAAGRGRLKVVRTFRSSKMSRT